MRQQMVYERGRLVPLENSERMRESLRRKSFAKGAAFGLVVGGGVATLAFTAGVAWACLGIVVALAALALKDGGGGETSGKAGNSVPGMGVGA